MKFNRFTFVAGIVSVSILGLFSACATTPNSSIEPSVTTAAATPDQSQPSSPMGVFVVEAPKPAPVIPKAPPEKGSLASVVHKMENSAYTLYWRENNSYTYYIGGLLDAEYKPGAGLIVQEAKGDDSGVTCQFSSEGKLTTVNGTVDQKTNDSCSKLMFTLDDELSD